MKKRLLSLALALALCLGLTVPAAAEEDDGYPDNLLSVSNIVDGVEEWDGGGPGLPMTCRAPVEIVTLEDLMYFEGYDFEAESEEAGQLEVLNKVEFNKPPHPQTHIKAGAKIVLTEPGVYVISAAYCGSAHDSWNGGGFMNEDLLITVVAGDEDAKEEKPAETEKPDAAEKPAAPAFTDVAAASPFAAAIDWAVEQKIAAGYEDNTFRPGNTCTVSHILTFLWRASGKPGAVEGEAESASVLRWATEQKMVENGESLSQACTRSLAVTFLWTAAGSPEVKTEKSFTDVVEDAAYLQAVAWAVENGVTAGTGDGTTFSPDNTCTRGQIATFLYRANQK